MTPVEGLGRRLTAARDCADGSPPNLIQHLSLSATPKHARHHAEIQPSLSIWRIQLKRAAIIQAPVGREPDLGEAFKDFLDGASYPCVGAKSALARGSIETHEFGTLGDRNNDLPLVEGLSRFVAMIESGDCDENLVHSYVAIFRGPNGMDERRFEALLWSQLWRIHKLDVSAGSQPAPDVSSDADSPLFSLSMAGHPFFVIGLHQHASRLARRFSHPVLVFNSHRQFEKLREDGRYGKMQVATRLRDIALQGSVNPNLADFGDAGEARQYSGRRVEDGWRCPFDFKERP